MLAKTSTIYLLRDPATEEVRYIGQSINARYRLISPERRSEIARIANLASQEAKKCRSRAE